MDNAPEQVAEKPLPERKTILVDMYCRTAAPNEDSIQAQEASCWQFAKDTGLVVVKVHHEIGSGMRPRRKKLARLRARCKAGKIQGVVVDMLDRLSRNAAKLLKLQQEMMQHHVALYCVKETVEHLYGAIVARAEENQQREN